MSARQGFPVSNGYAPAQGPRALPIAFDFSSVSPQSTDLVQEVEANVIAMVQSIYVDNSLNPNTLTIVFDQTNQKISVPATAQGIWPVITPKDAPRLTLSTTPGGGVTINIILLNVPMPLTQWGPQSVTVSNVTATQTPLTTNANDHGGTITLGGTSQVQIAANGARHRLLVENPSTATESLFLNFGATATVGGATSIEIMPGGYFDSGNGPVSGQSVNIVAATTGHVFIMKEW